MVLVVYGIRLQYSIYLLLYCNTGKINVFQDIPKLIYMYYNKWLALHILNRKIIYMHDNFDANIDKTINLRM